MTEPNSINKLTRKVKILIVDDDISCLELVIHFINCFHAQIFKANDGMEAIELFKQNPDLDLIIMDINMPKMDGLKACLEIKKSHPDTKIIANTAYATNYDHDNIMTAGFNALLVKPSSKDQFIEMIRKFVDIVPKSPPIGL